MGAGIALEVYKKICDFQSTDLQPIPELTTELERLKVLEEQLQRERFPRRLDFFRGKASERKKRIAFLEALDEVGVDRVSLPIVRSWNGTYNAWIYVSTRSNLFVGGVSQEVLFNISKSDVFSPSDIKQALFVGDIPEHAVKKFEKAQRIFGKRNIAVVSTVKDLFSFSDAPDPTVRRDPLMIGFWNDEQYLITAWGMEFENLTNLEKMVNEA